MKTLIAAAALLCVFASTASAQTYEDLVQNIEIETHSTPNIYDLCMSDSYIELNNNPEKYWHDFILYIQKDSVANVSLLTAIIAMQGLTTNRYADLVEECIDLYVDNKITEDCLFNVMFPIFIAGTHMMQFKNKKVVRALNKALKVTHNQHYIARLKDALSGRAFLNYLDYMLNSGDLRLDCNRIE